MAEMQTAKTKYGPRKIGEKAFKKQKEEAVLSRRGATKYGARKGGGTRAGDTEHPVGQDGDHELGENVNPFLNDAGDRVSIADAKIALEEQPDLLDLAIETEVGTDSPRKGAIEHYLKLESESDSGPREGVVNLLEQLLEE